MDGQEAEEFVDEGVIRCICGTIEDDGFTIQCEKCFVWQHAICVDITQESVPDIYFCENCNPRQLDYEKAAAIQQKRLKEERKKARMLEKQSPRKRKESNEFAHYQHYAQEQQLPGRKRIKDQQSYHPDDLLSPGKRFKEGIFDSPGRGGQHDFPHHEDWSLQSRTRLFLADQQSIMSSFTHLPMREPMIVKKKGYSRQEKLREEGDSSHLLDDTGILVPSAAITSPSVSVSTIYDSAYATHLNDFSTISNSYRVSKSVHELLPTWLDLSKSFPLAEVFDPFAESDLPDDWNFQSCHTVALLSSSKPWTLNAYFGPAEEDMEGKTKNGDDTKRVACFASADLCSGSFVAEIKGTICTSTDLELLGKERLFMNPIFDTFEDADICRVKTESGVLANPKILPPFVFPFPIMEIGRDYCSPSFFVDAREFGDFDGRFARFTCGSLDALNANAELRVVAVIDEAEIGDRQMYGRTTVDPSEAPTEAPLFPIKLTERFKLCIFTSRKVFKGDEIILANPNHLYYGFPCTCIKKSSCVVATTIDKIQEYHRGVQGEVMDTDNVFFDRMRESEHERRNLRLQQEQEAQQVPNLIWNYSVTQRILPHTLDNSLEDGEVGKPLSSDPVEEGGSAEAAADLVVETEPDSKMPDGNTGDTETVEHASKMDVYQDTLNSKMDVVAEPEKPAEPKRVNLMDFLKQKQVSTTSSIVISGEGGEEDAANQKSASLEEKNEETPGKKSDVPVDYEMKREESPEPEKQPLGDDKLSGPSAEGPTRISLSSSAIKALASTLATTAKPATTTQTPSVESPALPSATSITVAQKVGISSESKVGDHFPSAKSSPLPPRSLTPVTGRAVEYSSSSSADRLDSGRRNEGSASSIRSPSIGISSFEALERSSWKDDGRNAIYRERRESEPMYPLSRDVRGDYRGSGDPIPERSRSVRESFPPRDFRVPDARDARDGPMPPRDFRPDHRDLRPGPRDFRDGPLPPRDRDFRPDLRDGPPPPPRDNRDFRLGHRDGPPPPRDRDFRPDPRDGRGGGWYPPPPPPDYRRESMRGRGRGGGPYDSRYPPRDFRPDLQGQGDSRDPNHPANRGGYVYRGNDRGRPRGH